ncbi:MAG TPA: Gmad2 immunoglobulin-like domain-containing protein [Dehalococcoidia bacterium]|nr:Gmad2 immunoglobulin-like domain-containing protein [Dehalococcoidia bacterium]
MTLALSLALVACGDDDDDEATPTPTPSAAETETPAPSAAVDVCPENPDPATDEDLTVTSPEAGDELSSPFTVSGEAPEFEGRVWFRAYDEEGNAIFDQGGSTNFGHLAPEFEEEIDFAVSAETIACIEVYLLRPTEGGITDVVQIPVVLLPEEDTTPVATASPGEITNLCPDNPDEATDEEVLVTGPEPGNVVSSPFAVTGSAAAFEAVIQLTLLDAEGNELADKPGMTNEGQTLAPFDALLEFTVEAETDACLQVYMLSAENGEPINIAQVPLVLIPAAE